MTPEEILRDLRDIHLPEQAADAAGASLILWPAALVVIVALFAAWFAWRRRSTWRREIVRNLDRIEQDAGNGRVPEGWTALAVLLRRVAMQLCDRREIAGLVGDAWLEKLDHLFQTDSFSRGPGRGIAAFPYRVGSEDGHQEHERAARQLQAAIDDVRERLPHLGMVR